MSQPDYLKRLFDKSLDKKFHETITNSSLPSPFEFIKTDRERWIKEIWRNINYATSHFYNYLKSFINIKTSKFFCFPSWDTMMEESGISHKGIRNCLKELEEKQLIKIYKCRVAGTKYSKNIYFFIEFIGDVQLKLYIEMFEMIYRISITPA